MSTVALMQACHRGSVLAVALLFDAQALQEDEARRRVLAVGEQLTEVERAGRYLIAWLRVPQRVRCDALGATPLVRHGDLVTAAPLRASERAALGCATDDVVLAEAGRARVLPRAARRREDPAAWLEVGDFRRARELAPLGEAQDDAGADSGAALPAEGAALWSEQTAELATQVAASFASTAATADRSSLVASAPARARPSWMRALLGWLRRPGSVRTRLAQRWRAGAQAKQARPSATPAREPAASGVQAGDAPPQPSEALAPRRSERSRLARALARLSALSRRTLWRSALGAGLARRYARHLARLLSMFDAKRLDEALRHAVPLGGEQLADDGAAAPPLALPSPRADLRWHRRAPGAAHLPLASDLYDELAARYRRAVDQLLRQGQVEQAAFVLTELLAAHDEAVALLEAHGELRKAAELAELRDLPPERVVRLWLRAGDQARAIALASRHDVWALVITELARKDPEEADRLRRTWADRLAASGAYAAAVDALWPALRRLSLEPVALEWIRDAIEVGGPAGARMLVRWLDLEPARWREVQQRADAMLHDGIATSVAFAEALLAGADSAELRQLMRFAVRRLLPASAVPALRRALAALLERCRDPLLRADMRGLLVEQGPPPAGVEVELLAGGAAERNHEHAFAFVLARDARLGRQEAALRGRGDALLATLRGDGAPARAERAGLEVALRDAALYGEREPRDVAAAVLTVLRAGRTSASRPGRGGDGAAIAVLRDGRLTAVLAGEGAAYLVRGRTAHPLAVARAEPSSRQAREARDVVSDARSVEVELADGDLLFLTLRPRLGERLAELVAACGRDAPAKTLFERVLTALQSEDRPAARGGTTSGDREGGVLDEVDAPEPGRGVAVARFTGAGLAQASSTPTTRSLQERTVAPGSVVPRLARWPAPHRIELRASERGGLALQDVAELPGGKLLVALGEAGARLLARDGRTLAHFAEPASALSVSRHGDRAILLARRGAVTRLTRVDLLRRRAAVWCHVRIDAFASRNDGASWFVAEGSSVYAIELQRDAWRHSWKVDEPGTHVEALHCEDQQLEVCWRRSAAAAAPPAGPARERWLNDLPKLVLRHREDVDGPPGGLLVRAGAGPSPVALDRTGLWQAAVREPDDDVAETSNPAARGAATFVDVSDRAEAKVRLSVELGGPPTSLGFRFVGSSFWVFDSYGRAVQVDTFRGAELRRLTLR